MRAILLRILESKSSKCLNWFLKFENAIVFVFRMGLLILFWEISFHFIWHNQFLLESYNSFSLLVIEMILHNCAFLLDLFQYNVETDSVNRILRLKNTSGVVIGGACIGFEVTALFTALIISFKGPLTKKIWFIPFGVLIIYILNLIRICALALLVTINPEIWELNHKFIFTIIVYSFIFMMWRYWIQLNSNLR